MTRSTLEELLARCERATGSDRKLDAEIYCAANPTWRPDENISGQVLGIEFRSLKGAPLLTSSIDAIVGLIEAQMPEWQVVGVSSKWTGPYPLSSKRDNYKSVGWIRRSETSYVEVKGRADTHALALCAAFLRAKLSSPGGDE